MFQEAGRPTLWTEIRERGPHAVPLSARWDAGAELKLQKSEVAIPSLGDAGLATTVEGPAHFPLTILVIPFDIRRLTGIDPRSIRMFHLHHDGFTPEWNSGINTQLGFVWAMINRPGVYAPLGLPRDQLLRQILASLARQRRYVHAGSDEEMKAVANGILGLLNEAREDEIEELRRFLAVAEIETTLVPALPGEIRPGKGGHPQPFPLPGDLSLRELRDRLGKLDAARPFPEEALFYPPELLFDFEPPWPVPPFPQPLPFPLPFPFPWPRPIPPFPFPPPWFCWFRSRDWPMYHHDSLHTGHASGCSNLTRTTVHCLTRRPAVGLDGVVISIPAIVQGKVYVGTSRSGGGTLYKIDLATGAIDKTFPTTGFAYYPYPGVGGSPAVVGDRVYFTAVHGKVYCLDAASFTQLWVTDLKVPDPSHNQPISNPDGDCWSGPLVVNNRVYVGSGEGEAGAFGFIWCLDATTGNVIWAFCTNKFAAAADNSPNMIPHSAAVSDPLPAWAAAFTIHADPPFRGASVWSSCAYDAGLHRIYVGTGNSAAGLPDQPYGSGVLALDAGTGSFQGFFEPLASDSYYPLDSDIDVPASPMIFSRGGTRVVSIGSKNGSFFLLDAATMTALPMGRRQLLPKDTAGNPLPTVDPGGAGGGENMYGVFGTAAVHYGLGRLFVGLGGYAGIDQQTTPFMRALDWSNLNDAWATSVVTIGGHSFERYTVPPMYTSSEAGLSSPAVVNDVVFVSTSRPALYALDVMSGLCLWADFGYPAGNYALGPAISGNQVAIGVGTNLYIYSL